MARRKNNPCNGCGGDFFDKTVSAEGQRVWECRNCKTETPRQVRRTEKQKATDDLIERMLEEMTA